ncbi:MAG: hypothetical protein JWN85_667 [Gammaproteobacteria bacterium]|nr:hypothetical protein [Gammaproteobacteria bacterium]
MNSKYATALWASVPLLATSLDLRAAAPADSTSAANADSDSSFAEVVVTAERREEKLVNVGMTVASVGGNTLQNLGITSANDLPQVVSSLTVSTAADGTPVYTLRGVGFNATSLGAQPTVSLYYDQTPIPYGVMTQGPLFDLDHVEVSKGPQGTLYGQNSTGGAINYVTSKPTKQFVSGAHLDYGRFNYGEIEGFVSGPLTDTLTARLAVIGARQDDWQQDYLRDASLGRVQKYAARGLLEWKPTDNVDALVNVNGWVDRSDNQIPQFVFPVPRVPTNAIPALFTFPAAPADPRAADWDQGRSYRRDNHQWQVSGIVNVFLTNDLTFSSLSNYISTTIESPYGNDASSLDLAYVTTTGRLQAYSQEFHLSGTLDEQRGNFVLGLNYQGDHDNEGSFQQFNGLSSTTDISSPPLPPPGLGSIHQSKNIGIQSNQSVGVFGDVQWNFTSQWSALAGIRYTRVTHHNRSCTADTGNGDWAHVANGLIGLLDGGTPGTLLPGDCVTLDAKLQAGFNPQSFRETNVPWRVGLNYKPTDASLLYALISRGFKAGNYPVINAITRTSLRPVQQEELTSYELGAKANTRSIQVSGAVYYYDYKNKQLLTNTVDPIFGPVPTLGNVPSAHSYGADATITWSPVKPLTFNVGAAYQHTVIGPFIDYDVFSNPVQLKGHSFNFAPSVTLNADAEYRTPVSAQLFGFLGAHASYNSKTFADLAESPLLRIDPYTTLGLRAGVAAKDGRWDVTLYGRNVTNKYYWTNATLGYDSVYRIAGFPATYGIQADYKWD